jgi:hypothetical protein
MMPLIVLLLMMGASSYGDDVIRKEDAISYFKKMDCKFSAFTVYGGKGVTSLLGSLKSGQVFDRAICADSYEEGGAKKHDYCWLRIVDLSKGVYIGLATYGDAFRDEAGPCTKESLMRIIHKVVATDKLKIETDFREELRVKTLDELSKTLKYFKFQWENVDYSSDCRKSLGEPDEVIRTFPNSKVQASDDKITITREPETKPWIYFSSEKACKKDKRVKPVKSRPSKVIAVDDDAEE